MPLEMSKCHFDLAPLAVRTFERFGALESAHMLAFSFKQVAGDDPLFPFGAAGLQGASAAILGAGPVGHRAIRAHQAGASELFFARTDKDIGLWVKRELSAGEAELNSDKQVAIISTTDMREYAASADTTFEKAVFRLCLSEIVSEDPRWRDLHTHPETVGCLFDYCYERDDIVVGLRNPRLDHDECRRKITDQGQLAAIDALMMLTAPGQADAPIRPTTFARTVTTPSDARPAITSDDRLILQTMQGSKYKKKTVTGIAKEANIRREEVETLLGELVQG